MITDAEWTPADGLVLEPNALIAAREWRQSIALTAGPGAGKTEMLAQRADFLLRTSHCNYPRRILAIAFKTDASRNLRERVRQRCSAELARRLDSFTFHAFAKRLIDRFRPALIGVDALDPDYSIGPARVARSVITFEDMVPLAVEILKTYEPARNAVRETYSHVFLDEFQDCTPAQYQLIRTAFAGTSTILTAVGDSKQRIMGWAGALKGIFSDFAKDFGARAHHLYHNYRSAPRLRRMQNAMVRVMEPAAALPDHAIRGDAGEVHCAHFPDDDAEAHHIAGLVQRWLTVDGVPPGEIAILVSKLPKQYGARLMAALGTLKIPVRNEQDLQDLSTEPLALLIVDLITVVYSNTAPSSYTRFMSFVAGSSYDEEDTYQRGRQWREFLDEERANLQPGDQAVAVTALVRRFLNRVPRSDLLGLSPEYEQGTRMKDLAVETVRRVVELLAVEPSPDRAVSRFGEEQCVRLMTIHKSKGLEFRNVVVMAVEEQTFFGPADVERSAFFVAISRAKLVLELTSASRRPHPVGYAKRWDVSRVQHTEFLAYARSA